MNAGIAFVHQELNLFSNLDVAAVTVRAACSTAAPPAPAAASGDPFVAQVLQAQDELARSVERARGLAGQRMRREAGAERRSGDGLCSAVRSAFSLPRAA